MLRVAIPYGMLSSDQLRVLGRIAREYDRGYGHFTTRQNIQYNWVEIARVPDILDELAAVEMHGIQTSGNCIRNTTTDHLAGVAERASALAAPVGLTATARLSGLLHDVGKYTAAFQRRLEGGARVDHSTAGATLVVGIRRTG